MKRFYFLQAICLAVLCSTANADVTLLVDFHGNDNNGPTAAASSDFAANDSAIDLAATVNAIQADGPTPPTAITGVGIAATVDVTAGSGFNPTGGPFANDPILGDYIFGNNLDPAFLLTGLEEIAAGSVVTFVGYSHGDQAAQVADLVLDIDDGGTLTSLTSPVLTAAEPFFTFSFTTTSTLNSLSLRADNDGEGNQFAAINGFSLTTVAPPAVPEPASALVLVGMTAFGFVRRRRTA